MPSRSSSRKKSNRHLKKPNNTTKPFTSQPNGHSSRALQSRDELDPNILREKNGRNGNCPVKKPKSAKCQFLVVEEKKKKGFSDTTGHNEMEGSVEETRKVVEESDTEDKQVVVGRDEEKVKTVVESEVLAETQQVEEEQDSITVEKKEEESSSLVESEKIRDASELIVDDIKELEAELKQKVNQEEDSQETEQPPLSEQSTEPSFALETETSRGAEAAVDAATRTEADGADKLDSSEEKKESSFTEKNEALLISESSVPQTDVGSRAIEETTPIVKPEESGETKLPAEEQKVEESTVVKESSKEEEEATESLPPSDVAAAETTSTPMQEKTEIPASTESQQTNVNPAPREYGSWSSCCGIFDFLSR